MTQSTPRTESDERLARPLIRLAKACGVSTSYIDQLGTYVENSDEAIAGVLAALGVDASSDEAIEASLAQVARERAERLLPPTVVAHMGEATTVTLNCDTDADGGTEGTSLSATIVLEDGGTYATALAITPGAAAHTAELIIPADLPMGYHTLTVTATTDGTACTATATIICAPAHIEVPQAVSERHRWGWMAQMYSVRSKESWGVGDYADLKRLTADAAQGGADFMLINPIHACAPITPLEPSPYLPESRRFLNVTYIRPQDVPEYAELTPEERAEVDRLHDSVAARNNESGPMDINEAWDAKRPALRVIFDHGRCAARQLDFEAFKAEAGEDLEAWATWCTAFEVWGAPWGDTPWFHDFDKHSPEVAELAREHADLLEFHCWLQWIADEQVAAAQKAAKDGGMALGLMQDMAVGVHSLGADVWWSPERFALSGVTVGCPPDFYNQQGQDWGQPPFNPRYLEETGYATYRDMVHSMFAHAGAVRIDHVLGLFRLWWIPAGLGAKNGAYVTYDNDAMLSVLAIEATRANGMVIGEDLGTVPDYVRRILADRGVLGADVSWFARVDDSPNAGDPYKPPTDYREQALASVTTHDLPPTAGYLQFEHVKLREELHLLSEPVEVFAASAKSERDAMLRMLVEGGWLTQAEADDADHNVQRIVEAMHAMLAETPSLLKQVALVDGVGERRSQNQPGTSWEYCNWRVPLADGEGHPVHSDEVFSLPQVQSLAAIMNATR